MIIKLTDSPLKLKRFRVFMNTGKHYDFGFKGGSTYIDHKDLTKRENYRKRHLANSTENKLITNLVPSPALLAYYLLWGKYTNIMKNVDYLNSLWEK